MKKTKRPTPKEIKQFEKTARLLNLQRPAPTDADIERCIARLEARLAEKAINRNCSFAVKEGYTKSVELLRGRVSDLEKSSVGELQTLQGRAIAMCAMDYLIGMCAEDTLCGMPIKTM